jgi:hypothetical protein
MEMHLHSSSTDNIFDETRIELNNFLKQKFEDMSNTVEQLNKGTGDFNFCNNNEKIIKAHHIQSLKKDLKKLHIKITLKKLKTTKQQKNI